jgi:hypothetical protein
MFEVIGALTVWLAGGAVLFFVPIRTSGLWANTGEGIGDTILGFWLGLALLAVYVVATVVYLWVT